jgi:hypothetical protein
MSSVGFKGGPSHTEDATEPFEKYHRNRLFFGTINADGAYFFDFPFFPTNKLFLLFRVQQGSRSESLKRSEHVFVRHIGKVRDGLRDL